MLPRRMTYVTRTSAEARTSSTVRLPMWSANMSGMIDLQIFTIFKYKEMKIPAK